MSDAPITLFSTRAERFPQQESSDRVRTAIEKVSEQVPLLGPAATYIFSQVLQPGIDKRREEWFRELAEDFDRVVNDVDGLKAEALTQNERLVSATIQATRIAISSHQVEKRQMLRNALLKIATDKGPGEDLEQIFLRAIDDLTPSHLKVLYFFWAGPRDLTAKGLWNSARPFQYRMTYAQAVIKLFPEMGRDMSLFEYVMRDLSRWGFSTLTEPSTTFPVGSIMTNMGVQFLGFVLDSPGGNESKEG